MIKWYYIIIIVISCIVFLFFLTTYICFYLTFYSKNKPAKNDEIVLPKDEIYQIYKKEIMDDIVNAKNISYKEIFIKSFDGLTLYGKYYEYENGAPIEIMFHGYRGDSVRDMSTGVRRAFLCKRNALIVDQRASGKSQGHVITFGINERKDCVKWIDKVIELFGKDVKIILTGVSMGAATVINASSMDLASNVIGVLADCGYDSQTNIIKKTLKEMKLPVDIFYPFLKFGAKLFGRFNLEETSPIESIKKSNLPIIFIHGDNDTFVPFFMSENLYNTYTNKNKRLVKISNAGHGIAFLVDPNTYVNELNDFFKNI